MTMLSDMKADTVAILAEWSEPLNIHRAANTYDTTGKASREWSSVNILEGDWQPLSGQDIAMEVGRKIQSDAKVIIEVDEDVEVNDRIYRNDGSFMYVNHIRKYEDHWTIFLTKTEVS